MSEDYGMNGAPSPDGLNVADAYLKGTGVHDVQVSEAARYDAIKEEKAAGTTKDAAASKRSGFVADVMSSLVNGISNVPDGLATAFMVGVNPVHGLYLAILGPTIGSLVSSSQMMLVSTTVAASVFAGQSIQVLLRNSEQRHYLRLYLYRD